MAEIYIPTLHTFAMNNVFTGSCGDLRFKITPKVTKKNSKEVDFDLILLEFPSMKNIVAIADFHQ